MEYFVVCLVALSVSGLTLFSGFGLGTVLMPAFALFFPVPVAVAATAVVHLANNLFKTALVGRKADWPVVAKFALPGAAAAMLGAMLLNVFASLPPVWSYPLGGKIHEIALVELVIGVLIVGFAFLDLLPRFEKLAFDRKYLPVGGLLSGFFGGLSGIQGALRAAFLIKAGLEKEAFIGSSTVSAVIVDMARLVVYGLSLYTTTFAKVAPGMGGLILTATLAAFVGSFMGTRLMKKVTLRTVQIIVGVMLIVVGAGLASGLF
jgi:uncharacterized membrane protein YfcA